jgi:hypothetical protein
LQLSVHHTQRAVGVRAEGSTDACCAVARGEEHMTATCNRAAAPARPAPRPVFIYIPSALPAVVHTHPPALPQITERASALHTPSAASLCRFMRNSRSKFCYRHIPQHKSSQALTPQSCKEQGARIKKEGGMPRIIFRSHPAPPDVAPVGQSAGSTRLYSARSQTWSCACVLRE